MGYHKWLLLVVAVLVFISTGANVAGTYLLKPVINQFILPGDIRGLIYALTGMGIMYLCGALSTFGYNRLMVKTSQKVVADIRRDLFATCAEAAFKIFRRPHTRRAHEPVSPMMWIRCRRRSITVLPW